MKEKIYVLSQKHVGDIFLDSIVINSASKLNQNYIFNLIVEDNYLKVSKDIQKLLESKVNIIPMSKIREIKNIVEISPLERSFRQIIRILKLKLSKKFTCFFYQRYKQKRFSSLNLKSIFLFLQNILMKTISSEIFNDDIKDKNYFVNNNLTIHIFDLLIYTSCIHWGISFKKLKEQIIKDCNQIRSKYHSSDKKNEVVIIPSVGEKNGKSKKALSSLVINEILKENKDTKIFKIANFRKEYKYNLKALERYNHDFFNINELIKLMQNSKKVYSSDSFPAHLGLYLGFNISVFIPGYQFGTFLPYPNWFKLSNNTGYLYDYKNSNNFLCCGECRYCLETLQWHRIFNYYQ